MRLRLMIAMMLTVAAPAMAADGQALFSAKGCVSCHGAEGRKPLAATPALAGQNAAYLLRQIGEIADGTRATRQTEPMRKVARAVAADEMKAIADWLAAQPPAAAVASGAKTAQGAELFDEFGCIGCHGSDGLKPLADYPVLAGQRKDYLARQLKDIRDDVRSTRRTRLMVGAARNLTDAQVEAVADYLSQVKRN
jgi:cytochrome c553